MPSLPIVIDHCAKPVFDGTDPGPDWRRGIDALATHPQVVCKLSGLANEFGPAGPQTRCAQSSTMSCRPSAPNG